MALSRIVRISAMLVIDTVFFLIEIIAGYYAHSLALVADSFHMLNDVLSLVVALWAVKVAANGKTSARYSYGWQRAEILGALVNAIFLIALCVTIFIEAVQRFIDVPEITQPKLILIVGSLGLASNVVGLVLFHDHSHGHSHGDGHADEEDGGDVESVLPATVVHRQRRSSELTSARKLVANGEEETPLLNGHEDHIHTLQNGDRAHASQGNLNMQGVFLHVMGDFLGNIGVIATALLIWLTDFSWRFYFDPVISLVITCIILATAIPLCRAAGLILLQGTPRHLSLDNIKADILSIPAVKSVHELHVWQLSDTQIIASAHVLIDLPSITMENSPEYMEIAHRIQECFHAYGVHSSTIQPEFESDSNENPQVCMLNCGNNCQGGKCCAAAARQEDEHEGHAHAQH